MIDCHDNSHLEHKLRRKPVAESNFCSLSHHHPVCLDHVGKLSVLWETRPLKLTLCSNGRSPSAHFIPASRLSEGWQYEWSYIRILRAERWIMCSDVYSHVISEMHWFYSSLLYSSKRPLKKPYKIWYISSITGSPYFTIYIWTLLLCPNKTKPNVDTCDNVGNWVILFSSVVSAVQTIPSVKHKYLRTFVRNTNSAMIFEFQNWIQSGSSAWCKEPWNEVLCAVLILCVLVERKLLLACTEHIKITHNYLWQTTLCFCAAHNPLVALHGTSPSLSIERKYLISAK